MKTNVEHLADKLGGFRAMSRKLSLSQSTVAKWNERGGRVPATHNAHILAVAKEEGINPAEIEPFLDPVCECCGQPIHR